MRRARDADAPEAVHIAGHLRENRLGERAQAAAHSGLILRSGAEPMTARRRYFQNVLVALLSLSAVPALVSSQRAGTNGRLALDGMWNSATATPLERPAQLKDKPFFTPREAAAWERQVAE